MSAPHTTTTAPASPIREQYQSHNIESENCEPMDGKKRKYEEATSVEKYELYCYHQANPKLKQRELAEWFSSRFNRQINQSTVSRNLKKFKVQPPSPPGTAHEAAPRKRERKPQQTPTPQTHPIHHSLHHRSISNTSSNGLGPTTPPPRESRSLNQELYEIFIRLTRVPHANEEHIHNDLKHYARKIVASLPPQEQIRIDDAWINEWKHRHGIPPPSPASFTCHASPRASGAHSTLGADLARHHGSNSRSNSSEPRSPMSTVSSLSTSHRRVAGAEELPPVSALLAATDDAHARYVSKSGSPNPAMYDRDSRRHEMGKLSDEVQRRNERIQVEMMKRDIALNRLRELEKLDREESTGPRLAPIHA